MREIHSSDKEFNFFSDAGLQVEELQEEIEFNLLTDVVFTPIQGSVSSYVDEVMGDCQDRVVQSCC